MLMVTVLAGVLLALGGCASSQNDPTTDDLGSGSPGVRSSRSGLELRRWVIRGSRGQANRVLGVLADSSALDVPSEATRWEHSGVRAAIISAHDVEVLRDYLAGGAPAPDASDETNAGGLGVLVQDQIEWIGLLPEWVPIHRGPVHPATTAMIDSGPLRVDQGSVSLLSRAWVMPGLDGGKLHVELVPQVPVQGAQGTVFVDGAPLMRQHLGTSLAPGQALIVFPTGSWQRGDSPDQDGRAAQGRAETGSAQPSLDQVVGPPAPTTPTLGELMLVVDDPEGDRVLEYVLVFVAHLPQALDDFEVIERTDESLEATPEQADPIAELLEEPESNLEADPVADPAVEPPAEPNTETDPETNPDPITDPAPENGSAAP